MKFHRCRWALCAVIYLSVPLVAEDPELDSKSEIVRGETPDGVTRVPLLPPGPGNPRNSEGDFVRLKDGRLLFVYTHFTGGAGDHSQAHLAGRFSNDGGQSWTGKDVVVIPNEGNQNIMSVSLLRLKDGRIAIFYLRKDSLSDCRPVMRTSSDEAKTWSEPVEIIPKNEVGYYVLNNDRVLQLDSGRLMVPVAKHHGKDWEKWSAHGEILCYYSDDQGKSWKRGKAAGDASSNGKRVMTQEPGVVALKDGRIMLYCRTDAGSQFICYSKDKGESWSDLEPSNIISPRSPATIERIPSTGDLLLVWNDHKDVPTTLQGKRTPFTVAVSSDEGRSWKNLKTLEDNPHGWYCYTAITFVGDHVLLAHSAGDRRENNGLAMTQITQFPLKWIYDATSTKK